MCIVRTIAISLNERNNIIWLAFAIEKINADETFKQTVSVMTWLNVNM